MERKHRRERTALVVIAAIAILPPSLYFVAYFWLADVETKYVDKRDSPVVHRSYDSYWLATAFRPAEKIEERLMGYEVQVWGTVGEGSISGFSTTESQ